MKLNAGFFEDFEPHSGWLIVLQERSTVIAMWRAGLRSGCAPVFLQSFPVPERDIIAFRFVALYPTKLGGFGIQYAIAFNSAFEVEI